MKLKHTALWLFILFSLVTTTSAQQATKADIQALEKRVQALETTVSTLETTVNAMDKRLIGLEITVREMDTRLTIKIEELDKRLTNKIEELDKRLTAKIDLLLWAIGALIGIVLAVIALPQLLGYFQEKRGRGELQKQIQDLTQRLERQQQEIEAIKSR